MSEEISDSENKMMWLDVMARFILKDEIDIDNRVIVLNGGITLKSYTKFDKQLRFLENMHKDPITLVINSPGGSVYDGFAFVDRIMNSSCIINTQAMGLVASAAIPIFLSGDRRTTGRLATFMHHPPSYAMGHESLNIHTSELVHTKALANRINKFIASRTSKPYSFWAKVGKDTDFYFDAEQAIEFGVSHDYI